MTPHIKPLNASLLNQLQSQAHVPSLTSAINELVQNSVDAGARQISVIFDPHTLSVDITDDGQGITPEDLSLIGSSHCTSKIETLSDLVNCKTYGFQGRALFSIASMANVTILSKNSKYNGTWVRTLPNRPSLFTTDNAIQTLQGRNAEQIAIDSHGTTVMVRNFLFNIPVRKRLVKETPIFKTLNKLRKCILFVLIDNPHISLQMQFINLKGDVEPFVIYQALEEGCTSVDIYTKIIRTLYDRVVPTNSLKSLRLSYNDFSIRGVISKTPVRTGDLQFFSLNGRCFLNQVLSREINALFRDAKFEPQNNIVRYVGRPYRYYPLFILEVTCPASLNDMIQTPSKMIIDSTYKDVIHPLILKILKSFLTMQGYTRETQPHRESSLDLSAASEVSPNTNQNLLSNLILNSKMRSSNVSLNEMKGMSHIANINEKDDNENRRELNKFPLSDKPINYETQNGSVTKPRKPISLKRNISYQSTTECNHREYHLSSDISIDKSDFEKATVINQIDRKFILVKIPSAADKDITNLYILDQHACDERIILENIQKLFFTNVTNKQLSLQPTIGLSTVINESEINMFEYYKQELEIWGIQYIIDRTTENRSGRAKFSVTLLPDVVLQKCGSDITFLKGALIQHLDDLQHSRKQSVLSLMRSTSNDKEVHTDIVCKNWARYINCLPTLFLEIFNSKACRSAIKFGEPLNKSECELLILELSRCQQPFQCAHGRPSILPLFELSGTIKDNLS